MSLREQLLKAGLVSKDKVKQVETETRKDKHVAHKDKNLAAAEAARQLELRHQREAEAQLKRERDRQINQEREAQKKRKENLARARQLIDAHRLNEASAEIRYNFPDGRFIRSVRVTPAQQKLLATGRIGVVRNRSDKYDFPLLPREIALKVAEIFAEDLLLLYPEGDDVTEDGWENWE